MATLYEHKRGDSLALTLVMPAVYEDGFFTGWTVTAQLRTRTGKLVSDLTCAWVDSQITRQLLVTLGDTTGWPIGDQELDVQFVRDSDGFVRSTETVTVRVIRDVTREE